jgi:hypothetical protein
MRTPILQALSCALVLMATAAAAPPNPQRPLLLELFTSQGCSSCPPADAVLRELARHEDLLPLAYHVDYWNGLGWVDPYSSAAFTALQQDYAAAHGFEVYTPQLVVEGRTDVIGSSRAEVGAAIEAARGQARGVAASIRRSGGSAQISVGALASDTAASAGVYLLSFDRLDHSSIGGGENAGRQLDYANVVRSRRKVAEWRNQPLDLNEALQPEERGDRLALVVQDRQGRVWALASTP